MDSLPSFEMKLSFVCNSPSKHTNYSRITDVTPVVYKQSVQSLGKGGSFIFCRNKTGELKGELNRPARKSDMALVCFELETLEPLILTIGRQIRVNF